MPKISFVKKYKPLEVETRTNLMANLRQAGIPIASSCDGDGICAKCKVRVLKGTENLNPPTIHELDKFNRQIISKDERLSCQLDVLGDVEIDTDYW